MTMNYKACADLSGKSWPQCQLGVAECTCGFDSIERTIVFLEYYNNWRRGADTDMPKAKAIGLAIDAAIGFLKQKNT